MAVYENIWNLIVDCKLKNSNFLAADNPMTLMFGWFDNIHKDFYEIRLSTIKAYNGLTFPYDYKNQYELDLAINKLLQLLSTTSGRVEIANYLSNDKDIPELDLVLSRIFKLKAFF